MATLLHRVVEKALKGLLILPLRDLVIEYIGIIKVDISLSNLRWLSTQAQVEVRGLDIRKTYWGGTHDQIVQIGQVSPFLYLRGRDCNPPFECQLTFDEPPSTSSGTVIWTAQIDPDANKIINFTQNDNTSSPKS
jgi:hypothetical protein